MLTHNHEYILIRSIKWIKTWCQQNEQQSTSPFLKKISNSYLPYHSQIHCEHKNSIKFNIFTCKQAVLAACVSVLLKLYSGDQLYHLLQEHTFFNQIE